MKKFLLILTLSYTTLLCQGQKDLLDKKVTISFENVTIKQAIQQLESQEKISFAYQNFTQLKKKVTSSYSSQPLRRVLQDLFEKHGLSFKVIGSKITLYEPRNSKNKITISGSIYDALTGEALIGCVVYEPATGHQITSNQFGFYSLTLPAGTHTIIVSYLGYQKYAFEAHSSGKKNVALNSSSEEIKEVVATANQGNENITSNEMSSNQIDVAKVSSIPVLLGEKDVMKIAQLLPGVKSSGEGNSGFYVRGGGVDQNLILLDDAPIYNASHLLGFFSIINSDAINHVKLYKGAIPAKYGGRLSSVMDIRMKDGNDQKPSVTGGIGLIASKLTLEAPIKKGNGSLLIAGRRTYADLLLNLASEGALRNSGLAFYDLNMKANYKLGANDRIFLSGYIGRDKLGFADIFNFDWGNTTTTLRWNHIHKNQLFSNTSLIYSNYDYQIDAVDEFTANESSLSVRSGIGDFHLKRDYDYYLNSKNTLSFGLGSIYHIFKPGQVELINTGKSFNEHIDNKHALESSLYFYHSYNWSTKTTLNYGLRFNNFTQFGPGEIFTYHPDGSIASSNQYSKFEKVISYNQLSPRLLINHKLNASAAIKASYARTNQYLHLLSDLTSSTPIDVWLPSSNNIKPRIADQFTIGYFKNLHNNNIECSTEIYYRSSQNDVNYRSDHQVILNPLAENQLLFGAGRAYGVEFLVKKRKGLLTGWMGYSLSKSELQFDQINNGNWFNAKQDRTHEFSLVSMFTLSKRAKLSSSWVYHTGNAVTMPTSRYTIGGIQTIGYTERNGGRMPAYHRLDIGLSLDGKNNTIKVNPQTGKDEIVPKKVHSNWTFSIYNIYARNNAYSIYFRPKANNSQSFEAVQTSLFSFVPSINYNFKF